MANYGRFQCDIAAAGFLVLPPSISEVSCWNILMTSVRAHFVSDLPGDCCARVKITRVWSPLARLFLVWQHNISLLLQDRGLARTISSIHRDSPDPATPTVAAPAPMNLAAESISRVTCEVWKDLTCGRSPTGVGLTKFWLCETTAELKGLSHWHPLATLNRDVRDETSIENCLLSKVMVYLYRQSEFT